jgi:putative DNA primase/helicase
MLIRNEIARRLNGSVNGRWINVRGPHHSAADARSKELVRALGGQWCGTYGMVCCPAHRDRKPSLSIREKNGRVRFRCFAGCPPSKVESALRSRGLLRGASYSRLDTRFSRQLASNELSAEGLRGTQRWCQIWNQSVSAAGTVVEERYLLNRGIKVPIPDVLRLHSALRHVPSGKVYPAMIALMSDGVTGDPRGIHRTYLSADGMGKAPVSPEKMMLGPSRGCAVRLGAGPGPLLIGEGIETCLSVLQATGHSTWAALSAPGVQALDLPPDAQDIILIPDRDDRGAGIKAARHAARRWVRQGRRVRIAEPPAGLDFNDLLLGKRSVQHVG